MSGDQSLEPRLHVDLDAIAANWRALDALSAPSVETAAVVKADAYGLGQAMVAPVLLRAGARTFYVAMPFEGARLREILGDEAVIYVLSGYVPGDRHHFERASLRPVLNSLRQGNDWFQHGPAGLAAVQVDSGMNRLGLERAEFAALGPLPDTAVMVMSHLACADEPTHGQNAAQRAAFATMTDGLDRRRSLAATGGILLGEGFHHDETRPGIGLYGGFPFEAAEPVVTLTAPIIQIREVRPGEAVGYGATWSPRTPARVATVSLGYADGLIRATSNRARASLAGQRLPYAGRVSMDLVCLDVTHCAEAVEGASVEIIGPDAPLDTVAEAAGTIGYELLVALGGRYQRSYSGG
ncbi:MAG: alanine racemase [Paracoccaceae bacterium]